MEFPLFFKWRFFRCLGCRSMKSLVQITNYLNESVARKKKTPLTLSFLVAYEPPQWLRSFSCSAKSPCTNTGFSSDVAKHMIARDLAKNIEDGNAQNRNRTDDLLITSETRYHCAIRADCQNRAFIEINNLGKCGFLSKIYTWISI